MASVSGVISILVAVLSFLTVVEAAPPPHWHHNIRQALPEFCINGATVRNLYAFNDLKIYYSGSGSGNATFSLTNMETKQTETLSCNLRIAYQCQFDGTPGNKDLQVWLQLNLAAYFSFSQNRACNGTTGTVMGAAEMMFNCPDTPIEQGMTCVGEGGPVYANGTVEIV